MGKRFSAELLYRIRNEIPVADLLRRLHWPHKVRDGEFVFLCPSCGEMLAKVNPRTNLGRCFQCKRNFNTIELTMTIEDLEFVPTIHALQPQLPPCRTK